MLNLLSEYERSLQTAALGLGYFFVQRFGTAVLNLHVVRMRRFICTITQIAKASSALRN
jgi:hypothetical protein